MIKSLLYYIVLLLFVIYNCNTPLTFLRKFIPTRVGKYLLSFPVFIILTTILVVYPILTGKELLTFGTGSATTNIFTDPTNSPNRSALIIDDSGEFILEKNSDINKTLSDLVTSLSTDIQNLNSKVNNNTNVLKTQTENFVNATNTSLDQMNAHFANASDQSAITPAPPDGEVICNHGQTREIKHGLQMCKRRLHSGRDSYKNDLHRDYFEIKTCPVDITGAAWLTPNKNDASKGHYACIPDSPRAMFHNAAARGQASTSFPSLDFSGIQTN